MKYNINFRLIAFAGLLCSMAFLQACKKDKDDTKTNAVELLSFGPTGAKHGDTLRVIGYNLQRVDQVLLTNATVDKAGFISQADELILLIIPKSTQKGKIALHTTDGQTIESKTELDLHVTSSVTSITAQARPGENITIKGDYLNWVRRVTFAKEKVVTTFVSQAIDQLVVKVPDDAETGPLILFFVGTDSMTVQTNDTLKVTLPVATSFSPNPVKHQTNVTMTGTNLDLVKKIKFPGVATDVTSFVSQTATQLVVKIPSDAVNGKVTLYPLSGVASVSVGDLNLAYPAITAMAPNPVDIGANLTISGTNLDLVNSVTFQSVSAPVTSFVSQSATQLVVKVPTGAINGKLTFGIINTPQTVLSSTPLTINGYVVPTGPVFPIYEDGITSNWNGWIGGGWGGTVDLANASPVKRGTASAKISYVSGGWGVPLQLGGGNIALGPYTTFKISIYGGTGSSGKTVNIGFNEADGKTVTVVEGQWTDFNIPLSEISSVTTLTHLYVKNYTATGDYVIYIDDMGLN